jgi:hypothetical protein
MAVVPLVCVVPLVLLAVPLVCVVYPLLDALRGFLLRRGGVRVLHVYATLYSVAAIAFVLAVVVLDVVAGVVVCLSATGATLVIHDSIDVSNYDCFCTIV